MILPAILAASLSGAPAPLPGGPATSPPGLAPVDADWLPDSAFCLRQAAFARSHVEWLERGCAPWSPRLMEARRRFAIWDWASVVHGDADLTGRRFPLHVTLEHLCDLLGEEDLAAGRLPPAIPLEWCRVEGD